MSKNLIFCFSGTGNSLHIAKQIAKQEDADIIPMTGKTFVLEEKIESIGFVYPTYFGGLPNQVASYVAKLNIPSSAYTYAITTYGGMYANGIRALHMLLKAKNKNGLNYGEPLNMQGNYIVMYPMETDENKLNMRNKEAEESLKLLMKNIADKKTIEIKNSNWFISKYTAFASSVYRRKDRDFIVSDACINCKICKEICPVDNITMKENKPMFHGKCEQCMACIQICPQRAINYKNKTNQGKRYFHPEVTVSELISFNHKYQDEI